MDALLHRSRAIESHNRRGVTLELILTHESLVLHLNRYQAKTLLRQINLVLHEIDERMRCRRISIEARHAKRIAACSTELDTSPAESV